MLTRCTRPLQFKTHLPDCVCHVSFLSKRPLNLPLAYVAKSSKNAVFGPLFLGGWDTPDFGHAFLNHFRPVLVEFRSESSEDS